MSRKLETLPLRRTNLGSSRSRRQILPMQILHPSLAPCSNTSINSPTLIGIVPTTVRSAEPNIHSRHTASTRAPSSTPPSTALSACAAIYDEACRRTVSLLPEFALPYLRSSITVIALFLLARILQAKTFAASLPPSSPYQRGQFWLRRFRSRAETFCAALASRAGVPSTRCSQPLFRTDTHGPSS